MIRMPSDKHVKSQSKDLVQMSVSELKLILRSLGRKTKGRKSILIRRIQSHHQQKVQQRLQLVSSSTMAKAKKSQNADANFLRQRNTSTNGIHTTQSEINFHKMTDSLEKERTERTKIVLWRRPLTTLQYFVMESAVLMYTLANRLYRRKRAVAVFALLLLLAYAIYHMDGPHQKFVAVMQKQFLWCAYWVGLGVLSSVGLGTGLHTFLLYLGPHIAAVTLAAYECKSVNFPEPPYPSEIVCPQEHEESMSLWTIMSKVRLEAVMWGAGTAIGELPPYFMARAARLSGVDLEDDEFEEIEELIHDKKRHPQEMGFVEKAKLSVHNLVQKVGFFGILACASIPNPLFDLAGITCGHFLIPFWTFFGATLIGKAIIKMHIQKLFVIFMFSAHHVEQVVNLIGKIPHFGSQLQKPFQSYLEHQRTKLHHKLGEGGTEEGGNLVAWLFEKLVLVMVVYFILSILNSMAQNYHKRNCKAKRASAKKDEK